MASLETLLQELVDARGELARGRRCRLADPAQAVDPRVHTPDRVCTYLTARGWRNLGCGGSSADWRSPDGAIQFLVPLRASDPGYPARIGQIARTLASREGTGELDILAAIAQAPATDWQEVRAAQLLARIRAVGGEWSDARAAAELRQVTGTFSSRARALRLLRMLEERGEVVAVRPPAGRTFELPDGPAQPPALEWGNRLEADGRREVVPAGPKCEGGGRDLAMRRIEQPGFTAVLQRTVTYGPWVRAVRQNEANYD